MTPILCSAYPYHTELELGGSRGSIGNHDVLGGERYRRVSVWEGERERPTHQDAPRGGAAVLLILFSADLYNRRQGSKSGERRLLSHKYPARLPIPRRVRSDALEYFLVAVVRCPQY
jgi:hypothetical protein